MKKTIKVTAVLAVIMMLSGCIVERDHYRGGHGGGYHSGWGHHHWHR